MRTVLVTEVFPPLNGGSGRWFWEIYSRMGTNETLVVAGKQDGDECFDKTHQLNLKRLNLTFPSWGLINAHSLGCYFTSARQLHRLAKVHRATQIHCGKTLPEGLLGWMTKFRLGIPFTVYVHGEELGIAAASRELRWLTASVLKSAKAVVANSNNTAALLQNNWAVPRSSIKIIHPGVDVIKFRPKPSDDSIRTRLGWRNRLVVLTVGRLQKRKGQDKLIQAIATVRKRHPNVLYSIVGDGGERVNLVDLVNKLGLNENVEFRGALADADMLTCYQQCDLFALPNRTVDGDFEGFGMVLLEAQACGKPVLTGISGGTGEAMQEGVTGLRVDCDSADAIASAIDGILSDEVVRKQMGDAGRLWVEGHFSWESLITGANEIFSSVEA
jgi:phosphatidyl-myo-inositol dimannoside synthase